ncbi:MAG: hypothetical protein H6849_01090 [Alphaproteobacteria bacterium]|nr:MAG: hypothetical protein H6849_01090 [Alphaproteobacteria bacterium]
MKKTNKNSVLFPSAMSILFITSIAASNDNVTAITDIVLEPSSPAVPAHIEPVSVGCWGSFMRCLGRTADVIEDGAIQIERLSAQVSRISQITGSAADVIGIQIDTFLALAPEGSLSAEARTNILKTRQAMQNIHDYSAIVSGHAATTEEALAGIRTGGITFETALRTARLVRTALPSTEDTREARAALDMIFATAKAAKDAHAKNVGKIPNSVTELSLPVDKNADENPNPYIV